MQSYTTYTMFSTLLRTQGIMIVMSVAVVLSWGITMLPRDALAQKGRYEIEGRGNECALSISLTVADRIQAQGKSVDAADRAGAEEDVLAILMLYATDNYYGQLFTERKRVGLARKKVEILFDNAAPRKVHFVSKADDHDDHWRWQYLKETEGLLDAIRKKNRMRVVFSNGKDWFRFKISLKGSSRAVTQLEKCAATSK